MSRKFEPMQQLSTATVALFNIRDSLSMLICGDMVEMEKAPPGITAIIRMVESEAHQALRAIGADK